MPDHEMIAFFYDSNGNQVGWRWMLCNGNIASGGTITDIYEESYTPCASPSEPMTCSGIDEVKLAQCPYSCYSDGWYFWYEHCVFADCEGNYASGCLAANRSLAPANTVQKVSKRGFRERLRGVFRRN